MIIYEIGGLDEGSEFFPSKRAAIKRAKEYGAPNLYVSSHDIGKLTKERACQLASGQGFSLETVTVWEAKP
jgi:hypothetical protein